MNSTITTCRLIKSVITLFSALVACGPVFSQNSGESPYDELWNRIVIYENDDDGILNKFSLTGRLQGDYHSFDEDSAGSKSDFDWRRFRVGFKAIVFGRFMVHSEADMNLNQPEPLYQKLTDTYVSWSAENGMKFKVGRQSAPFTLDGSTSSKKLHTLERGKIADNIWFGQEYFPGVTVGGAQGEWNYFAGIYSSDNAPEFADAFDYGKFGIVSLGRDGADSLGYDQAMIRFDLMVQDEDQMKYKDWKSAYAIVTKWKKEKFHFWSDLNFANRENGDAFGLQLMPFYDLTDKTQAIFCYTFLDSSNSDQLKPSKWERSLANRKGNELSEYFFGLNHFFYGHKLKWQSGLQYTDMKSVAANNQYDGWGFTTALRISW